MNSRSTLILVLVTLIVGGLVVLDHFHGTPTDEAAAKRRQLVDIDGATITRLELARTNETILIEKQGEHWQITEPLKTRADYSAVRSIIDELEFAQRERSIQEKERSGLALADFGLDQPRVRLAVTGKDGKVTLLLGGLTPTKDKVYVQVQGQPAIYVTDRSIESRLDRTLNDLRDRTVLDFLATDAVRLELKSAERAIELSRTDGRWQMLQPLNARANQSKVDELLSDLSLVRVQEFVSDDPKDIVTYRFNEPVREVTVWTGEGGEGLTLLIGRSPTNDATQVYAKRKGADAIFTISADTAAKLDIASNDLREKNVFAFSPADVHGLALQRGVQHIALARTNEAWRITAPFTAAADETAVGALLGQLTSLTIAEYSADVAPDLEKYGLAVPAWILTLNGTGTNTLAQLLVGSADADRGVQYVKHTDEPFIYGVTTNLTSWLPTSAWSLHSRQIAELSAAEVTRLEIVSAAGKTVLQRGADQKWQLVEPAQGVLDEDGLRVWLGVFTRLRAEEVFDPGAHPAVTAQLTVTVAVGDKTWTLLVSAPDPAGQHVASWSDPALVFTLSGPTVQTLQKNLVKAP